MEQFDRDLAAQYMYQLIKQHRISIIAWNNESRGKAWCNARQIRIPKPLDIDRWGVCLHEIKHIIDGHIRPRYLAEFKCDKYALDIIQAFGYKSAEWEYRMNRHVLEEMAFAHNAGKLDKDKIPMEIILFYPEVDFRSWDGSKVTVYWGNKDAMGYKIEKKPILTQKNIRELLEPMGLELMKFGNEFVVKSEELGFGKKFPSIDYIASYFKLNK